MLKFDHLRIPVTDLARSREWYMDTLGLTLEFEVPDRNTVALQDSEGFTIFLQEAVAALTPGGCALWFQVADVDATFAAWSARGVLFGHEPRSRTGATGPSWSIPTATCSACGTSGR